MTNENHRLEKHVLSEPVADDAIEGLLSPREMGALVQEIQALGTDCATSLQDLLRNLERVVLHRARSQALSQCAQLLSPSAQEIRLYAGELSAQEMRATQSVLRWKKEAVLDLQRKALQHKDDMLRR